MSLVTSSSSFAVLPIANNVNYPAQCVYHSKYVVITKFDFIIFIRTFLFSLHNVYFSV